MRERKFMPASGLSGLVTLVIVTSLFGWLLVGVSPAHAESFSVTMNCPNNVSYSFTNDTNTTNQYYITVTDSQGHGLGSTSYSTPLKPGGTLPSDSSTTLSFDLVQVPAAGDLTATLWRVDPTGSVTNVTSVTLTNCWPPSLSTPNSPTTAAGTPSTSRIHYTCAATGVVLRLTDDQNRFLSTRVTFGNQALLAIGPAGIYRSLGRYGVLSIAGSMGWDGMYYYAAWNGGVYHATGQQDFSLTFKCPRS